jgi:hypothetical protein
MLGGAALMLVSLALLAVLVPALRKRRRRLA